MQITGNHQLAWIVRHNDESIREGYIRNGGKEVKLFTSALKAFQCNNRIVMAQRKHVDDFLRGRIIGRLECGRTQLEVSKELGIAQSVLSRLWKRFQDDGNVSRCNRTGRPRVKTLNEDRYIYFAVIAKNRQAQHQTCLVFLFSYRYDSFKAPCTTLEHIGLYARRSVRCVPFNLEYRACIVDTTTVVLCDVFRLVQRVGPPPAAIHAAPRSGIELIRHLMCPEADGSTNLKQSTLNHVQSDTMASAVLADPTRSLQGTNRGSEPVMKESKNDVGSLEQLLLRNCRCSGVKGSARKGRLDLRFASARCLEIVCGTIATPTSAPIIERVTVGSPSAYRTILRSSLLVVFLVAPDPVFRSWVPSRVHCSQQFITAHSERSTWPATWCADQPSVFIPMIRPL
ncbi:HTH_Tnp_Tc3_2 domain-containing protein [Trichonephila clavipes]|nr:HTH_Tnp_Tc3_2 domain-containing protein [Trichonephila clavipes]